MDNKFPKSKMKLVLTNKRLIIQENKKISEISLEQINRAHGALDSRTSCSSLILDMKDDEQIQVTFEIVSGGINLPKEGKKITDNFLTEINQQIKDLV